VSSRASAWAPAGVWALVIFLMSTDSMSADHTRSLLMPILRFVVPSLSQEAIELVHFAIRKLAHVGEYLVFAVRLDRGFRRDSPVSASWAPIAALAIAALYSLTDEAHQAFVASRGASLYDCGFDSLGAATGALISLRRAATSRG